MRSYCAYIRVSTVKQGEQGSSLHEQKDAITHFAARNGLEIAAWFEERETAARVGRREFTRMLAALKKGTYAGVIFHKIDRSARNLKDWGVIQDLAEQGVDVRFSQEAVNLASNEGRLTGDFLAVIASHYIRNLREEVKKGLRGRLKQGIYPLGAPIGYLNQGGGKPKIPDPERASLIKQAFELYGTGAYSLRPLSEELYKRGLRTKSGKRLYQNRLLKMLRNPFYMGIIRMSGETYPGIHEPLVSKAVFDRVQRALDGKKASQVIVHDFLFRRMITCAHCGYRMIGEKHKSYVYYRCHTKDCPTIAIREEIATDALRAKLQPLHFEEREMNELRDLVLEQLNEQGSRREDRTHALNLRMENVRARLSRLVDAYTDGMVEKELFAEKKLTLLMEQRELQDEHHAIQAGGSHLTQKLDEIIELLKSLQLSYEYGDIVERRDFLNEITSNIEVDRKNVAITLRSPFREIETATTVASCGHDCNKVRIVSEAICALLVEPRRSGLHEGASA